MLTGARATAVVLGRVLAAAEATGGAQACVTMASEYAKVREQFGRVIAMFQAVKHQAADMLVATQLATAATWDAARTEPGTPEFELAAAIAAAQALPAFVMCAEKNIQLHGGIGFTWEHDAHVYLKRALSLAAVFGPAGTIDRDVARLTGAGVQGAHAVELPPEAETYRAEVRTFVDEYRAKPEAEQLGFFLDSGYALAHWTAPWGRAAGAVEQLVIEEELRAASVRPPQYGIGGWIIQTLTQYADHDQLERWIRPSLEYQHTWCQLFSEPGAGSDAAGVRTKATKVDGGWKVTGQKVWTTGAAQCDRGLATVRTDPDKPKHDGITVLVIDLHAPGVDIRPLREATGHALFNEVFFDDVFVSDEDVVGPVNGGWKVARSTLGNERVSIGGGGGGVGDPMFDLLDLAHRYADDDAPPRSNRSATCCRSAPACVCSTCAPPSVPSPAASPAPRATWPSCSAPSTASAKPRWRCASSAPLARWPKGRTPACSRPRSSPAASPSPAARRRSSAARSANASSASPATPCCADALTSHLAWLPRAYRGLATPKQSVEVRAACWRRRRR